MDSTSPSHAFSYQNYQVLADDNCPICIKNLFKGKKAVIHTNCPKPHFFHLDCLSSWFDKNKTELKDRKCCICQCYPFPLLRTDGVRLFEANPYCHNKPMHCAYTGDIRGLKQIINLDKSIVEQYFHSPLYDSELTLLHMATFSQQLPIIKQLIYKGANTTMGYSEYQLTPLHIAASNSFIEAIHFFIDAGVDPNIQSSQKAGRFSKAGPLHNAAALGQADAVKVLLEYGAKIDARMEMNGATPLHLAALEGYVEVVDILINAGADKNIRSTDEKEMTPLHLAAMKGRNQVVTKLVEAKVSIDAQNKAQDITPLFLALASNKDEVVETLLQAGACPNNTYPDSPSCPVPQELLTAHIDFIVELQKYGAIPGNKYSPRGSSLLHMAVMKRNLKTVQLLEHAGAKINATQCNDLTPLHIATAMKQTEITKYLIDKGANTSPACKTDKTTPLHFAVLSRDYEAVCALVDAHANLDALTNNGISPLMLAKEIKNKPITSKLIEAGAKDIVRAKPCNIL